MKMVSNQKEKNQLLKETALYASLRLKKIVPYLYVKIKDDYVLVELSLDPKEQWEGGEYKKSRYIVCFLTPGEKHRAYKWLRTSLRKRYSYGNNTARQYTKTQEMVDSIVDYIVRYRKRTGEVYKANKEECDYD